MHATAGALATAVAEECPIVWRPIGEIPFTFKGSGSAILIWSDGCATVGRWADSGPHAGSWINGQGDPAMPTHYAMLNAPAD